MTKRALLLIIAVLLLLVTSCKREVTPYDKAEIVIGMIKAYPDHCKFISYLYKGTTKVSPHCIIRFYFPYQGSMIFITLNKKEIMTLSKSESKMIRNMSKHLMKMHDSSIELLTPKPIFREI